jgi:hypothetical protein
MGSLTFSSVTANCLKTPATEEEEEEEEEKTEE